MRRALTALLAALTVAACAHTSPTVHTAGAAATAAVVPQVDVAAAEAAIALARPELATTTTTAPAPKPAHQVHVASAAPAEVAGSPPEAWTCGGDLPSCTTLNRENPNRDLLAYNGGCHAPVGYTGGPPCGPAPRFSTACGKWQIVRGTWGGYGGYVNACDAPWQVQDERARQLAAGRGRCTHWREC